MQLRLRRFSFRFAEQVLNSKLAAKTELEQLVGDPDIDLRALSRPAFNRILKARFTAHGWEHQPKVFEERGDPDARMDFLKERIGVEVEFGHRSFLGMDLLKFQVASYSGLNRVDVGVLIVTTKESQRRMGTEFEQTWDGSLSFERVVQYLPHLKSAIQVPVYVLGLEL